MIRSIGQLKGTAILEESGHDIRTVLLRFMAALQMADHNLTEIIEKFEAEAGSAKTH